MNPYSYRLKKETPLLFTCEHASRTIPRAYRQLGLSAYQLRHSKDWNDPGALELAKEFVRRFDASFLYSSVSRLVIDANRRLDAHTDKSDTFYSCALKRDLLIEDVEGERLIPIPGNRDVNGFREERRRWTKYVEPYQKMGERMSGSLIAIHGRTIVIQIHSFYPSYNGIARTVDIDIVSDTARDALEPIFSVLQNQQSYRIGDNHPWGMKDVDGGIFDSLQRKKNILVFGIDVNNKHLSDDVGIHSIAALIGRAIAAIL